MTDHLTEVEVLAMHADASERTADRISELTRVANFTRGRDA
jgi:hypothetical protein